jgi:pimeloyl-ACP methyl ester carboxylesterase
MKMLLRTFAFCTFACALLLGTAARADVLDTTLPAPKWTKMIGTLRVQKYGTGSPALILVPGLSCGSWTYADTIAREAPTHTVYAVTPAGFDGVPNGKDDTLSAIDMSLSLLIASEKLDHPVLIGHSLGGTAVLRYGIEHSAALGGVISVDGTPVLPFLQTATPDMRRDIAGKFEAAVLKAPPSKYAAQETEEINSYVTDQTLAAHVATLALRSDQRAVGAYGRDLYDTDLRAQLPQLTVRTLLIVPVPAPPIPMYYPQTMTAMTPDERRVSVVAFYQALVHGAPSLTIAPVDNSRHFVMLDQPAAFAALVDGFLAAPH